MFIWLAQVHHLSQLIDAPGGSCWLLEPLWASIVALDGSWRKYMKTIVVFSKTYIFHYPVLFWTSPNTYFLDHSQCMKIIVLSTSGSNARKPSNQASWDWFWWLGTILHQENILLSDQRSLGHLLVGPLYTHRTSGGPTRNMCHGQTCFYHKSPAAAVASHTRLLPAKSVLPLA